jgi:hypothetical protein
MEQELAVIMDYRNVCRGACVWTCSGNILEYKYKTLKLNPTEED